MNGVSQLAPKQPRSVSPIACIADSTNEGSMATNGNHLTVPFSATLNGNGSAVISVDHVRNLKRNTSACLNPTSWVFKQVSRRILSWQTMIILLLLDKLASNFLINVM